MLARVISNGVRLTIMPRYLKGFSDSDMDKHQASMKLLEEVLNSQEFRDFVLTKKFTNMKGKTNQEVYNLIMSGSERLSPEVDYELDLYVEMYHANNSVVGWTKPSVIWTKLNRKFFSRYDYAEVAGNAFHEWLHKLGFGHSSAKDHNSIPYSLGYHVKSLVKDLIKGVKLTDVHSGYVIETSVVPTEYTIPDFRVVCSRTWKTLWLKKSCRRVFNS